MFRVQGLGIRVQGLGTRVQGSRVPVLKGPLRRVYRGYLGSTVVPRSKCQKDVLFCSSWGPYILGKHDLPSKLPASHDFLKAEVL